MSQKKLISYWYLMVLLIGNQQNTERPKRSSWHIGIKGTRFQTCMKQKRSNLLLGKVTLSELMLMFGL